jgi:hypothetical protein
VLLACGALTMAALLLSGGCSLGLDESKLGASAADANLPPGNDAAPAPETSTPDASAPETSTPDAGPGCNADTDCVAPNACLTPRCDVARHTCVFDLCKQATTCTHAACDTTTHACGAAAPVPFHPGSFVVPGGIGCGGVPGRCFAAATTFVYVGTTNGVSALPVGDPGSLALTAIPVGGVPFAPAFIVASGGRVFFVGGLVGGRLQVAWLDSPTNPLVTSMHAQPLLLGSTLTGVSEVFAAPTPAGVYLEQADPQKLLPTVLWTPPTADLATLTAFPNTGAPAGAAAVAASGDRLVLYRWTQQGTQFGELFTIVTGTGSAGAKAGAETNLSADIGVVWGTPANVRFAAGANGALVWGVPLVQVAQPVGTRGARVAWVLDGTAATPSATAHVDLEVYDPSNVPLTQPVSGPLAWVDATTVLALAQAPADLGTTSVQVAQNGAAGPMVVPSRRVVLPIPTEKTAAVSINGYGYVLSATAADSVTVDVFAPACP